MKPEGHEIEDEKTAEENQQAARRGPFRFGEFGIPIGADLTFVDDPTIIVKVVDDRHIQYGKETTSLSALARRIKGFDHPVQGTLWFKYQGEILSELRERKERNLSK